MEVSGRFGSENGSGGSASDWLLEEPGEQRAVVWCGQVRSVAGKARERERESAAVAVLLVPKPTLGLRPAFTSCAHFAGFSCLAVFVRESWFFHSLIILLIHFSTLAIPPLDPVCH